MFHKYVILILIFWCSSAFTLEDQYLFDTHEQQTRFVQLTEQLRCLVCQNQNLSESHAPLAYDLRKKIASLIVQGQNDQDILKYIVNRYGEFVLYNPQFSMKNSILWLGPFLFLIMGVAILYRRIRQ